MKRSKRRSRQNPPASGLCLPKLQRNHNSSVLKVLQIISFVFRILKNGPSSKWFVWKIMRKIDTQGYPMPEPVPDLDRDQQCPPGPCPNRPALWRPALGKSLHFGHKFG